MVIFELIIKLFNCKEKTLVYKLDNISTNKKINQTKWKKFKKKNHQKNSQILKAVAYAIYIERTTPEKGRMEKEQLVSLKWRRLLRLWFDWELSKCDPVHKNQPDKWRQGFKQTRTWYITIHTKLALLIQRLLRLKASLLTM